jgi:hypothetical protein
VTELILKTVGDRNVLDGEGERIVSARHERRKLKAPQLPVAQKFFTADHDRHLKSRSGILR